MPIRALFFDLDDTLCDTIGCRPERMRAAIAHVRARCPELDPERLLALALEPAGEPRAVRGLRSALEAHGLAGTPLFREASDAYNSCYAPLRLFPGVIETLTDLASAYPLGIITNAEEWYQREKVVALGLAPYIRFVVISGVVGHHKPDPRIFMHALQLAGVAPDAAVFIGDRLDVDIAGAQAAGMRAIWFNHWGGELGRDGPRPDAVIDRFPDLPSVLRRSH